MFGHVIGLFSHPNKEWHIIRDKIENGQCSHVTLVLILALIPPLSGYIGTTQVGWKIGTADPVKLTQASALIISVAYYFAIVVGIFLIGYIIQWMGNTYVKSVKLAESVALAAFVSVPILLIGIFEIYPVLWINFLIGLVALAYSVFLLYSGLPILMDIPKEKGFLYSSAILGFGLVALVGLLVVTAMLWGVGIEPSFTR